MTFTLAQLQKEQVPWVKHNFGERPKHQPLLGLSEEVGELAGAVLRMRRKYDADEFDEVYDALADITVFLCDYSTGIGIDLSDGMFTDYQMRDYRVDRFSLEDLKDGLNWSLFHDAILELSCIIGFMNHHHLKLEQKIRGDAVHHQICMTDLVRGLIVECHSICHALGEDYYALVERTWNKVKQRDWAAKRKEQGVEYGTPAEEELFNRA